MPLILNLYPFEVSFYKTHPHDDILTLAEAATKGVL